MTCQELVELVTDYLEGRLAEARSRRRLEAHLPAATRCTTYLEQMRVDAAALSAGSREETICAGRARGAAGGVQRRGGRRA